MVHWILLVALTLVSLEKDIYVRSASPFTSKHYRTDYEYNAKTDAFYKLHIEGGYTYLAGQKCAAEGARLVGPLMQQDLIQVHAMFKKFPDLGQYVVVASDGGHHEAFDETSRSIEWIDLEDDDERPSSFRSRSLECDVMDRQGEVVSFPCFASLPFACKVDAKDAPYNEECDVYSNDYVSKVSLTGSCYRISTQKGNWNEAYANCQAEGANLVVLNDEVEFEVVKTMIQATPRAVEARQFFVGIRAERKANGREFYTVHNQTLEQVGYQPWDNNEPNNEYGVESCVAMLKRTGKYNDTVCRYQYSYICEKKRRRL